MAKIKPLSNSPFSKNSIELSLKEKKLIGLI